MDNAGIRIGTVVRLEGEPALGIVTALVISVGESFLRTGVFASISSSPSSEDSSGWPPAKPLGNPNTPRAESVPRVISHSAGLCAAGDTMPPACDYGIGGARDPAEGRNEQDTATDSRPAGGSRERVGDREVAAPALVGRVDPPGGGAHLVERECEPRELARLEALPRDGVRRNPPASGYPERARGTERAVAVVDEERPRVVAHVPTVAGWSTRRTSCYPVLVLRLARPADLVSHSRRAARKPSRPASGRARGRSIGGNLTCDRRGLTWGASG